MKVLCGSETCREYKGHIIKYFVNCCEKESIIIIYSWIYICYVEESRPPLWSSVQSSWLQNGDVLWFLWGTNWIYICYVEESGGLVGRVPGYRFRSPGFYSRRYQIFWEVVGLERSPLCFVSTTEELLERKSSSFGLENQEYGRRGSASLTTRHPSIRRIWHLNINNRTRNLTACSIAPQQTTLPCTSVFTNFHKLCKNHQIMSMSIYWL
jgi:hypothetical protein